MPRHAAKSPRRAKQTDGKPPPLTSKMLKPNHQNVAVLKKHPWFNNLLGPGGRGVKIGNPRDVNKNS